LVLTPALRVAEVHEDDVHEDAMPEIEAAGGDATTGAVEAVMAQAAAPLHDDDEQVENPAHDYSADPYNFDDDEDLDGNDLDGAVDTSKCASDAQETMENHQALEGHGDDNNDHAMDTAQQDNDASGLDEDTPAPNPAALSAKIAALETAIGNIADTWEPDAPGADDYSGTEAPAMAWEDDIDRDATGAPFDKDDDAAQDAKSEPMQKSVFGQQDVPQPDPMAAAASEQSTQKAADEDGFAYGTDDQLLDEEALRDLVSDIVRSELQGALGERITRNVRKLVRREIHRALTAQELE
jgi:hypothetical protein